RRRQPAGSIRKESTYFMSLTQNTPRRKPRLADEKFTDLGNARRLVALHGENLRFVPEWGWLVWDGRRWCKREGGGDGNGIGMEWAKETIRELYAESARLDDASRDALVKHAKSSERAERLRAMVSLAESEPTIRASASQFDRDPYLLNCRNGIIDLRTGEHLPHERERYMTVMAPVEFDPEAGSDEWTEFVAEILNRDEKLIDFVQKAVGYSATGLTTEEVLFLLFGPSRTGKSTFLEALHATLGEYAATCPFDTFLS